MYCFLKRFFDLILTFTLIVLLSWLFLICIIVLWLTGEHYIWYLQERIGYKNKHFRIIKFATMLLNSPNMGTGSLTTKNDPRILPVGAILRKTKINELPQLFNVVNGTMSLVGPRPQMAVDFYRFPEKVQEHIYDSVPGITGIGSIVFRDEEHFLSSCNTDPTSFYIEKIAPYKGELELWYLKNKSFWVDFKILLITAWVVVFPSSTIQFKLFKNLPQKPNWMEI